MIHTLILVLNLPEVFQDLRCGFSPAGSMHTLVKAGICWGRHTGVRTVVSLCLRGMLPMGEEAHPGRAGRPVGVDLGRIGWHTYQSCQRDLGRDAGWKLGTWRLMHGLGPASASVLPPC